jgi:hypothetical protein
VAVRTAADAARDDLISRIRQVLDANAAQFATLLTGTSDPAAAQRLRAALTSGDPSTNRDGT